jgi:acetyl esterase/lipase
MDIVAPTSGGPWPLIILLPGGPRPDQNLFLGPLLGVPLAGQGAVVMAGWWRTIAAFGGGYPTSFADVACAIGVARKIGPAYGASPDRVTLVGHSLGGWSAAVVALTPSPFTPAPGSCNPTAGSLRPDAFVSLAGAVDWVKDQLGSSRTCDCIGADYLTAFFGGDAKARPDAWLAADPFALAKRYPAGANAIPIALVQGGADRAVPPTAARSFQAVLVAAGYRSRLVEVSSADHLSIIYAKETIDAIITLATAK